VNAREIIQCDACQTGSVVASSRRRGVTIANPFAFAFSFETFKKARENGTQT